MEKALLIEMIVEKMPTQRKKVYQLKHQGLTNEEIAKELDTTKRNVESQISLALKEACSALIHYLIVLPEMKLHFIVVSLSSSFTKNPRLRRVIFPHRGK